jgi:hypothetical protein
MKGSLWIVILIACVIAAVAQPKDELPLPDTGNVTLSLEEYNKLIELAGKPVKKPDLPPLPYVLKRADLKLHVTRENVQGEIQLEGEVLKKGAVKVPLVTDMTIFDARKEEAHLEGARSPDTRTAGKNLPLEQEGGKHVAMLSGPAEFTVALDAGMPLNIEAGRASFSLPVPAAGSVRLTMAIPGDHTNVRISPGLITAHSSANGKTTIEATLVPGRAATIWWATRELATPAAAHEVRFLSSVKTLVSVDDAGLKVAALADLTMLQGETTQFEAEIPEGYEFTGATGSTLVSSDVQGNSLFLNVSGGAQRNHEFLISMEKAVSATQADAPLISFKNSQRETGEVLVEGVGTMELTAKETGGLKRIDWKEVNPHLRALSRFSPQAAFRYHRQPTETPHLGLEWVRYADSSVLAAVAERAIVTTLVTSDGKSLTEVRLVLRNQAQPYLKIPLPKGASMLTADVAGEPVKLGIDKDGSSQVPLLRANFRPTGPYEVSFVFMHSGAPFAKKGGSELALPEMELPISLLQWEVFLPEQYKVKDFGGDAIATGLLPPSTQELLSANDDEEVMKDVKTAGGNIAYDANGNFDVSLLPGQLGGFVTDSSGAVVPNAQISVVDLSNGNTITATTDQAGHWVASNIPSGRFKVSASMQGFKTYVREITNDANGPLNYSFRLSVGTVSESVEVTSGAIGLDSMQAEKRDSDRLEREAKQKAKEMQNTASVYVGNLQQRVAGVLPVRVDVPRTGNSYRFVRPLVLAEETRLTFSYNSNSR